MTKTQVLYITSHFVMHFILIEEYIVYAHFACKQVEWTPYTTFPRALLKEHPRTMFIEGITYFDIVEVYFPGTGYLFRDLYFYIYLYGGVE